MGINFDKFDENGFYDLNNEIRLFTFNGFLNWFFESGFDENIKINETNYYNILMFNNVKLFFERVDEIKNNYFGDNLGLNKNYKNPLNVNRVNNSINNTVFNDIKWVCELEYLPMFKLLTYMYFNNFNNDNTIVIMRDWTGDEKYTFFNIVDNVAIDCCCMDDFKIIDNYFHIYYSLVDDVIIWG